MHTQRTLQQPSNCHRSPAPANGLNQITKVYGAEIPVDEHERCAGFHNSLSISNNLLAEIMRASLSALGVAYTPNYRFLVFRNLSQCTYTKPKNFNLHHPLAAPVWSWLWRGC